MGCHPLTFIFCKMVETTNHKSWQNNGHWIGWREHFLRKQVFFLWNMGCSCRCSLKEIQWNGGFRFVMGVAKMHPVLMDEHELVLKQPWWLGVVPYFRTPENGRTMKYLRNLGNWSYQSGWWWFTLKVDPCFSSGKQWNQLSHCDILD